METNKKSRVAISASWTGVNVHVIYATHNITYTGGEAVPEDLRAEVINVLIEHILRQENQRMEELHGDDW